VEPSFRPQADLIHPTGPNHCFGCGIADRADAGLNHEVTSSGRALLSMYYLAWGYEDLPRDNTLLCILDVKSTLFSACIPIGPRPIRRSVPYRGLGLGRDGRLRKAHMTDSDVRVLLVLCTGG